MASAVSYELFSIREKAYAALLTTGLFPLPSLCTDKIDGSVVKPQQRLYFLPEPQGHWAFRGVDFGAGAAGLQNETP